MLKYTVKPPLGCWFFHRWVADKIKSTSHTAYSRCAKCGARKITQSVGGYQPVDFDWASNITK